MILRWVYHSALFILSLSHHTSSVSLPWGQCHEVFGHQVHNLCGHAKTITDLGSSVLCVAVIQFPGLTFSDLLWFSDCCFHFGIFLGQLSHPLISYSSHFSCLFFLHTALIIVCWRSFTLIEYLGMWLTIFVIIHTSALILWLKCSERIHPSLYHARLATSLIQQLPVLESYPQP